MMAALSLFRTMSPVAAKISPGIMAGSASGNWVVNTHEFGSIRERRFHLHFGNHLDNAFHHLLTAQNLTAPRHELSNRLAVPCALQDEIDYERNTRGIIELDTPFKPFPSDNCRQ